MNGTMLPILGQTILMIAFGFLLTKTKIMDKTMQGVLSKLLLKGILPVSILSSSSAAFSSDRMIGFGMTALIALIYYIVMLAILTFIVPKTKMPEDRKKIFITLCTYANVAFIGIPLSTGFFGEDGLLYAIAFNICYNLTLFSLGITILGSKAKFNIKTALGNVAIIMAIIALIIYMSPFRFPTFIQSTLSSIGSMMTPVSMMVIGFEIGTMNIGEILKDKFAYLATALRMLIVPLAACIILSFFDIDPNVSRTCVLLMALPAGSFNIILGQQYNADTKFAASVITQNILAMIVTLPIVMLVMEVLL